MIVGLSNEKKTLDYIEMRENCCIIRHTRMKIAKKKMHYSLKKNRGKNVFRHMEKSAEIIDCIHSFQKM
jgi:hypothetical protein